MKTKSTLAILIILLALNGSQATLTTPVVQANPRAITVPDEFLTIQEAIEHAALNDIIYVKKGIYNETLAISKTISLIGESENDTVIDALGKGVAIWVSAHNVTIKGLRIKNGATGIYLADSDKANIHGNLITNNDRGIILFESDQSILENNLLADNFGIGIELENSHHNHIKGNTVTRNPAFGIYLLHSNNNTIIENTVTYICDGLSLEHSSNNIVRRNTLANNSPHGIYLNYASNNTVDMNWVKQNNFGIQLFGSENNIIVGNNVTANNYGLNMVNSGSNRLWGNNISLNAYNFGVSGNNSSHFANDIDSSNTVDGKPIYYLVGQSNRGIPSIAGYVAIIDSRNILLKDLNLTRNMQGVLLARSVNITIENLTISENFSGGLFLWNSETCTIRNNEIKYNIIGITLINSSRNLFYHNNFIKNIKQVECFQSSNVWDNGYPSGGNYWSERSGLDARNGYYQDQPGADGTLDVAYIINLTSQDRYPLAGLISQLDAGTWNNVAYFVEFVSNSKVLDFRFNPDEGAFIEFNVASPNDSLGFGKAAISKQLLWVDNKEEWKVFAEDKQESTLIVEDSNHTYLYFNFEPETGIIRIEGTRVVTQEKTTPFGFDNAIIYIFAIIFIGGFLGLGALYLSKSRKSRT